MFEQAELCDGFGTRITAEGSPDLSSVPREAVIDAFSRTGVLLLRGFRADVRAFREFVEQLVEEPVLHPNYLREAASEDRTVLLVDPNEVAIPAHSELAYSPMCPELLFFHCIRPASDKGATTLHDGARALEFIDPELRRVYEEKRLKWSMLPRLPKSAWAPWLGTDDQAIAAARLEELDDFSFDFDADEALYYEYLVSAITESRFSPGVAVFSNSCLLGSPAVTFEDGSELSREFKWDALDATERVAFEVDWQPGDVVMLDNKRFMHGRRGFRDDTRSIASMLGNANF